MGLSPRTLRPANNFTPRSITGLALWLDASDASSLYTTDAGAVTPVSAPTEIAGCLCWYDASDATSITKDGSNLVSQWNDKSGNARHATASGSLRPTSGGSQNGRTVMQFTGTQALTITGNFLQADNVTMFAVAMKNTDHYGGIISSAPTNPEDSPILCFYLTTIAWLNRRVLVQQATGNSVYRIVSGQSAGTTQQGWFDGLRGTDITASVATNTANTITKIGALRTSSTADLNGNIAEIICYSGNLSVAQRASVEAYLAAKWGISGVHAQATATSDPVGAWLDKSGNARHATQSTAGNRPTISATAQGGKNALAFAASTRSVTSPVTVAQYISDATTSPKSFFAWVARPEGGSSGITFGTAPTNPNSASRVFFSSDFGGGGSHIYDMGNIGGGGIGRLTGAVGDETNNVGHVYSAYRDGAVMSIRRDGVEILRRANASGAYTSTTGTLSINIAEIAASTASWMEFMAVAGVPSVSNITRIERYLASKWGIQLLNAPQVSNADARDWINRVYAWNGTVSSSTATAVNDFCNSIDSAGIRDRFYRLNLFCGGTSGASAGLAACLVPLYRSTAYGGTVLGGNIDTNTGPFVVGDYAETGTNGGLLGNGTSKFLKTGLTTSALPQIATGHLSVYASTLPTAAIYGLITSWGSGFADPIYAIEANRNGAGQLVTSWGNNFPAVNISSGVGTGLLMTSRTAGTSLKAYRNGSQIGTTSTTNITPAANTGGGFGVFANAPQDGAGANWFPGRLAGYSIGAGMDDTQAAAFSAAMTTFQAALGRNV